MEMRPISNPRDAHARLVLQLCEALSTFVASTAVEAHHEPRSESSVNDNAVSRHACGPYDDIISLRGILVEFGLKPPQVVQLRKNCGFPEPIGPTRPIMFRRGEVEHWLGSQPSYWVRHAHAGQRISER